MSQLKADKMNGAVVHLGDIATTIQARASGVGSTAIRGAGDTEAGMEATAQVMATSRSMTTTTNMPIKDTTRAATAGGLPIFQEVKPMAY